MKHCSDKYSHIQDTKGMIPADEPVFLLRGQDKYAPELLILWAAKLRFDGGEPELEQLVEKQAQAMLDWQKNVKVKKPNLYQEHTAIDNENMVNPIQDKELDLSKKHNKKKYPDCIHAQARGIAKMPEMIKEEMHYSDFTIQDCELVYLWKNTDAKLKNDTISAINCKMGRAALLMII